MTARTNSGLKRDSGSEGFSLIEVLIAMVILMVGLLGVAMLMGVAIQNNMLSKNISDATNLAETKLEQLKKLKLRTAPEVQPGGSLTANQADHFVTVTDQTTRWLVAAGPGNTRDITVRVIPNTITRFNKSVEMRTIVRIW
jgi:Tfp pilus assembly protein PilV